MFKKLAISAIAVLPLLAAQAPTAAASGTGTLYAMTRSQNLTTVDPATGSLTVLSNLFLAGAVDSQMVSLVANPLAGRLYGERMSFVNTSSGSVFKTEILTINASTGGVLSSVPGHYSALVVDQSTGTLYGFDASNNLVRVNPSSGATTKVATIGTFCVCIWSVDIDPNSHTIYISAEDVSGATEDATTQVFTVNTTTGAVSAGVLLGQTVRDIVVDPGSGQVFGVADSFTHDLLRIDPSTGATEVIATIVPSGDTDLGVNFGLAADGVTHTVFADLETFDITTGDVSDQVVSIQDQSGGINVGVSSSDAITALAFAGPAVPITPDTLKADVQSALASGAISKAGVAKTLLDDLDAAQAARDRGQCKTASNIYQQFISDVTAQTGKSIAASTASKLISEAQFLAVNCP
jgi:uncharacterized protein DUF4394/FIMAH domain-containing protein